MFIKKFYKPREINFGGDTESLQPMPLWLLPNIAFPIIFLCGVLRKAVWAKRLSVFSVWNFFIATMLVASSPVARAELARDKPPLPARAKVFYDRVCVFILAVFGWFISAAAWTVVSTVSYRIRYSQAPSLYTQVHQEGVFE